MKNLKLGIFVVALSMALIGRGKFADATELCKIEGNRLGSQNIVLFFDGVIVRITNWVPKEDSPGEYVGFTLEVVGGEVAFWVKAGQEFFRGEGTTWMNPYGTSGSNARGISHIDFCENPPVDTDPTTTTTTTLGGNEAVTTTTTPATTTTTDSTTTTTLPGCGVVPILEDPTILVWSCKGQVDCFFTHGRLIPLTTVDYPIVRIKIELETVADGVWHTTECSLTQVSERRWKCRLPGRRALVKVKPYRRTGEDSYAYRLREQGEIGVPTSMLIKINVYLLCETGTHTGLWLGELGKEIRIKF